MTCRKASCSRPKGINPLSGHATYLDCHHAHNVAEVHNDFISNIYASIFLIPAPQNKNPETQTRSRPMRDTNIEHQSQDSRLSMADQLLDRAMGLRFEPTEALRRKLERDECQKQGVLGERGRRAA